MIRIKINPGVFIKEGRLSFLELYAVLPPVGPILGLVPGEAEVHPYVQCMYESSAACKWLHRPAVTETKS